MDTDVDIMWIPKKSTVLFARSSDDSCLKAIEDISAITGTGYTGNNFCLTNIVNIIFFQEFIEEPLSISKNFLLNENSTVDWHNDMNIF